MSGHRHLFYRQFSVMQPLRAIVIFRRTKKNISVDLDIPLSISAQELVTALNEAYHLGIDLSDPKECWLTAEDPIALLRGGTALQEFGVRNGTTILFTRDR